METYDSLTHFKCKVPQCFLKMCVDQAKMVMIS